MLHIVNKSPFAARSLERCLSVARDGHALLLIEDGVYGATTGTASAARVAQACQRIKVYVLQPDLDARGLGDRRIEGVTPVDYAGFVDLTLEQPTTHSWL